MRTLMLVLMLAATAHASSIPILPGGTGTWQSEAFCPDRQSVADDSVALQLNRFSQCSDAIDLETMPVRGHGAIACWVIFYHAVSECPPRR